MTQSGTPTLTALELASFQLALPDAQCAVRHAHGNMTFIGTHGQTQDGRWIPHRVCDAIVLRWIIHLDKMIEATAQ